MRTLRKTPHSVPISPHPLSNGRIPPGSAGRRFFSTLTVLTLLSCFLLLPITDTSLFSGSTEDEPKTISFFCPVKDDPYIIFRFGYRKYKRRGRGHKGVDIKSPLKHAPIYAAADGKVTAIRIRPRGSWGRLGSHVFISHNQGFRSLYGHLSKVSVKINQEVKAGDLIGYMGKTGYATTEHLHFVIYQGKKLVNPENYIECD